MAFSFAVARNFIFCQCLFVWESHKTFDTLSLTVIDMKSTKYIIFAAKSFLVSEPNVYPIVIVFATIKKPGLHCFNPSSHGVNY